MTTMTLTCTDCKTNAYLVDDYKDGSVVCTKCGLVASDFLPDERPLVDTRRVDQTLSKEEMLAYTCDEDMMNIAVYGFNMPIAAALEATELFKAYKGGNDDGAIRIVKGHNMMALKAAALYIVCRKNNTMGLARSPEDICSAFQTTMHHFTNAMKGMLDDGASRSSQSGRGSLGHSESLGSGMVSGIMKQRYGGGNSNVEISRIPYWYNTLLDSVCELTGRDRMALYRECQATESHLMKMREFVNKKPVKLAPAILYVVYERLFKKTLDMEVLVRSSNVSVCTLRKSIDMIRQTPLSATT